MTEKDTTLEINGEEIGRVRWSEEGDALEAPSNQDVARLTSNAELNIYDLDLFTDRFQSGWIGVESIELWTENGCIEVTEGDDSPLMIQKSDHGRSE